MKNSRTTYVATIVGMLAVIGVTIGAFFVNDQRHETQAFETGSAVRTALYEDMEADDNVPDRSATIPEQRSIKTCYDKRALNVGISEKHYEERLEEVLDLVAEYDSTDSIDALMVDVYSWSEEADYFEFPREETPMYLIDLDDENAEPVLIDHTEDCTSLVSRTELQN